MANFKLALTAGHYLGTQGKNCHESLDPNKTKEWVLNDRIADKIEERLANYDGIEILRTDDTTGKKEITLEERVKAANKFDADFYLSIHHNAADKLFSGGGIVVYIYKQASSESAEWQKLLYNALIDETGLKGNRSNPMPKANLYECKYSNMPAVLLELGFMDSTSDCPIILTEEYADKCADAIVKVIVKKWNLPIKKVDIPIEVPNENLNDVPNNMPTKADELDLTKIVEELNHIGVAITNIQTIISSTIDK